MGHKWTPEAIEEAKKKSLELLKIVLEIQDEESLSLQGEINNLELEVGEE